MKNLFQVCAFAVCAFVAVSVRGEALYWQVSEDSGQTFDFAQLRVKGGDIDGYEVLDMVDAESGESYNYTPLTNTDLGQYASSEYSFFVEMLTYANDALTDKAAGKTYTYQELVSSGYVATGLADGLSIEAGGLGLNMGSSGAIPEPSSGLLLLMGGAMLALRRRRQK